MTRPFTTVADAEEEGEPPHAATSAAVAAEEDLAAASFMGAADAYRPTIK